MEGGVVGDADADGGKMVVIKVVEVRILGEDKGEFARDELSYKGFGIIWDEGVFGNGGEGFGYEGEDFAGIIIAVFEAH